MKRAVLLVVAMALCAGPPVSAQRIPRGIFVTAADGSGTPVLNLSTGELPRHRRHVIRQTKAWLFALLA